VIEIELFTEKELNNLLAKPLGATVEAIAKVEKQIQRINFLTKEYPDINYDLVRKVANEQYYRLTGQAYKNNLQEEREKGD